MPYDDSYYPEGKDEYGHREREQLRAERRAEEKQRKRINKEEAREKKLERRNNSIFQGFVDQFNRRNNDGGYGGPDV